MEDSLKKRYVIKLLSSFINGLVNLIIVAIVPKALGPVAYGQFTFLKEFFSKIIAFLDMGSSIAFFTKLSADNRRGELIPFYFSYSLLIFIFLLLTVYFMNLTNTNEVLTPNIPILLVYMGLFFSFFTWFTTIYIKIADSFALTVPTEILKIVHRIISSTLLLFFVFMIPFNLNSFFFYQYLSLLSFILLVSFLFIKYKIFFRKNFYIKYSNYKKMIGEFIHYCSPLVMYNLVILSAGLFDIWLLQKMSGNVEMGFYGFAFSLAAMSFIFTGAMTPVITREFSKFYAEKNLIAMNQLFYRYIPMMYSLAAFFAIFLSIQSGAVIEIFAGEEFKGAFWVVVVMAFYPIHQTYGQLSGSIFYATGQTKLIRNISFWTQPFGLIVSFLLISYFDLGAVGLALKIVLIQFIAVSIQLYFNAKLLNLDIKYFLYHQTYSLIFFGVIGFFSTIIVSFTSTIANFFVSGVVYTMLVILLAYIFPQIFAINRDEIKINILKVKEYVFKK